MTNNNNNNDDHDDDHDDDDSSNLLALLQAIEKAQNGNEQVQALQRLQEVVFVDTKEEQEQESTTRTTRTTTTRTRTPSGGATKEEQQRIVVTFLLQKCHVRDDDSTVMEVLLHTILTKCHALLVWQVALDTLQGLLQSLLTDQNFVSPRLPSSSSSSSSLPPLLVARRFDDDDNNNKSNDNNNNNKSETTLSLHASFVGSPPTCLETTLKVLLRLVFPRVVVQKDDKSSTNDVNHDKVVACPFVLFAVGATMTTNQSTKVDPINTTSNATTNNNNNNNHSSQQEQQEQLLSCWIQAVLVRLPMLVANACQAQKVGLPRIWMTTTTTTTTSVQQQQQQQHVGGWYGRLLQQALTWGSSASKNDDSSTRTQDSYESKSMYYDDYYDYSPPPPRLATEYALLCMVILMQQRGATEIVARVLYTMTKTTTTTTTSPGGGGNDSSSSSSSSSWLMSVLLPQLATRCSPRNVARLYKACWQVSSLSSSSSSSSTTTSSTTTTTTTDDSSWSLVVGRILLGTQTAVQRATVQELLHHSPTTTTSELRHLVQVLLSLQQKKGPPSSKHDEETEEESESDNDDKIRGGDDDDDDDDDQPNTVFHSPPEWTDGQCILMRHATNVAQDWSSLAYIRQTDPLRQERVGKFLELALPHFHQTGVPQDDLLSTTPLVMHIVHGVSSRLESLQPLVRQNGMRVAEIMARILGQDLSFDELHNSTEPASSEIVAPLEKQESTLSEDIHKNQSSFGLQDKYDADDDSVWDSGDEDFQPYGLEDDEEDLRETPRPTYLRDCLDLLRTPETQDFARSHHETALQELPALVRAKPMDLVDIAPSLARQVLRMEDKFSLDGFEDMVNSSLVALVFSQPVTVAETLIEEMYGEGSLADRLKGLASLCEAAYELSGYKDQVERKQQLQSTQRLLDSESRVSGRRKLLPETTTELAASDRTRRWGKKTTAVIVSNQFTAVAPLWFYALLGNFMKRREDPVLWGGAVGSMLLSKLLLTLAMIVELAGRGRATEIMAKDLFECVWGFRQAEVPDVRIACLSAVTSAISNMQDDHLLQILSDEQPGNLPSSLKQIVMQDSNQEVRDAAAMIAKNITRSLESMGPLLLQSSSK